MLEKIENSIESINRILNGNGLLTQEIYSTSLDLLAHRVPTKWCSIWEGPDLPNSWLKGFCKRVYSLKKWVDKTR